MTRRCHTHIFCGENVSKIMAPGGCGEKKIMLEAGAVKTWMKLLVCENPENLAEKRCRFIARRQQYDGNNSTLKGAYLPYDNEEEHIFYSRTYDYNAEREGRIGGLNREVSADP